MQDLTPLHVSLIMSSPLLSHSIDCQPSCALRSSPAVMDQGKTLDTTALLGWPACCHIPYLKTRGQTFVCAAAAIEFLGISGCMEHLEHHLECVGIHSAFRERDGKQQAMISLEAFILFMFGGVPACKVLQKNSSKFENVKKVRQFVLDKIAPGLMFIHFYGMNFFSGQLYAPEE